MAMRILAIVFALAGAVCWLWPGEIGGCYSMPCPSVAVKV
jgi:hypothetical protein